MTRLNRDNSLPKIAWLPQPLCSCSVSPRATGKMVHIRSMTFRTKPIQITWTTGVVVSIALAGCSHGKQSSVPPTTKVPAPFSFTLSGDQEGPAPGDPNASGHASVTLRPATSEICIDLSVDKTDQIVAVHLQEGPIHQQGPIVLPLPDVVNNKASGCRKLETSRFSAVRGHPDSFFINVRTAKFPGGSIRGQLAPSKPVPQPTLPPGVTIPPGASIPPGAPGGPTVPTTKSPRDTSLPSTTRK
jgi:hypothetical protein